MRVLLDTNILLDGIFLDGSNSRKILQLVQSGEIDGYISKNILFESWKKIRHIKRTYNIDLSDYFSSSLRLLKIFYLGFVSEKECAAFDLIPGSVVDKSLVVKALEIDAFICSKDIKDLRCASGYGVQVLTPKELADKISGEDASITLVDIFSGFYHSSQSGTFIMEVTPHWPSSMSFENEPFFYVEGVGCLFYEFSKESVVFELDEGARITTSAKFSSGETIKIHLSYSCEKGISLSVGKQHRHLEHIWDGVSSVRPRVKPYHNKAGNSMRLGMSTRKLVSYPNFMKKKDIERIGKYTVPEMEDRVSLDTVFGTLSELMSS